jgi:hypothetical protein
VVARIFQVLELGIEFLEVPEEFFLVFERCLDFVIPGDLHRVSAMGTAIDGLFAQRNGLVHGVISASAAFLAMENGVDFFFDDHATSPSLGKNLGDSEPDVIAAVLELSQDRKMPFQQSDVPLAVLDQRFRRAVPGNFLLVLAVSTGLQSLFVGNLHFKYRPIIASAAFVSEQHVSFSSL